ncbi:MAG: hypothetical protein NXY57DRAFT_987911 [Lentinula lateritia]|uniref:Steroid 5-alpha reductase C-terminal domain-containing protein n=1 Tax=Lentinula lateritia TaxID=40482 RepID=A0ABQ8VKU9_9AGAR|nr:MAG: hypothetical protein NXY57DRAFT_987911 [Lentinula lateritia]KAJ4497048.1 hypothetical protein C8R41DRAFT_824519 [Lentinula lateritia]
MLSRTLNWQTAVLQLVVLASLWFFSSIPGIAFYVYGALTISSTRPWSIAESYLISHPYSVLCCSTVVFLGPISFVLPVIILQDTCIHVCFNIIHLFHGYISVWNRARYYYSSNNAMDFVPGLGGIFAWLEWLAATYNTWTTEHKPLLVIRICAAILGIYVAFSEFYFGW